MKKRPNAEFTADLMVELDNFMDCLQLESRLLPERDDRQELVQLLQSLAFLKERVSLGDKDGIGTAYAKIRRSIYDGAFVTPAPSRAYIPFDRVFQRWLAHVLYPDENV